MNSNNASLCSFSSVYFGRFSNVYWYPRAGEVPSATPDKNWDRSMGKPFPISGKYGEFKFLYNLVTISCLFPRYTQIHVSSTRTESRAHLVYYTEVFNNNMNLEKKITQILYKYLRIL